MQERRQGDPTVAVTFAWVMAIVAVLAISPARSQSLQLPASPGDAAVGTLSAPVPIADLAYTPGRGLRIGDTHVMLGGYGNINLVRDEGSPADLRADDLSLFVIWDPTPRMHFFSEPEFEDIAEVDSRGHGGTVNHTFTVERLYGDLTITDLVQIRVGKFLTPVGRWNVIHAQPLVWTTSRPLATLLPFDPHVTGAMLFGSLFPDASSFTYSLFGQFVNEFDRVSEAQSADRSAGGRLEYTDNKFWSLGSSYLSFTRDGHWQHLIGIDGLGQRGPVELMSEAVFEDGGLGAQWGLYIQNAVELKGSLYAVGRYEHYAPIGSRAVNLVIPGIAYKPLPYIVLKAEYLIADHPAPESPAGFKSSFAMLF